MTDHSKGCQSITRRATRELGIDDRPTDHSKGCQSITREATRESLIDDRPTTVKVVRV